MLTTETKLLHIAALPARSLSTILWLLLVVFLLNGQPAYSQHYSFHKVTSVAGEEFPSLINHVMEGNRGFLWISTRSGLGRYDGNRLKKYDYDEADSLSLPSSDVFSVLQDKDNELWVFTLGGVARYDYRTDKFLPFFDNDGQPLVAASGCAWREGLLFGCGKRVFYYNKRKNSLTLLAVLPAPCWVEKMLLLDDNTLLYQCRSDVVWRISLDAEASTPVQADGKTFSRCVQSTDVLVDKEQRIWISSSTNGLYCYSAEGELIHHLTKENSKLCSNHILSLAESDGLLMVGTRDEGLLVYDLHTHEQRQFKHELGGGQYTLPGNQVKELFCDRYGNVLMSIVNHGLVTFDRVAIRTYIEEDSGFRRGPTDNTVMSLYPYEDDLWVGTSEDGLNRFDPEADLFTAIPATNGTQIFSITGFTPGKLLLSVFNEGLRVFDIATGRLTPFTVVDAKTDKALFNSGNGVYVWQNSPETILIVGDSLYVYHLKEQRFSPVDVEQSVSFMKGTLRMVGTEGDTSYLVDRSTLFAFDHPSEKLTVLYKNVATNEVINTAIRTADGLFWMATNHGLKKYDPETQMATYIPTSWFKDVMSLQADPLDRVWVGTYYGLFLYDPSTNRLVKFNQQDGAQANEYIRTSSCCQGSHVYMGGVHGLVQVAYAQVLQPNDPPSFSIADCILDGKSIGNPFYETKEPLEILYGSNFSLHVLTLEKNNFRSKEYRFRVTGQTNELIESPDSRLRFYNLAPGNYSIEVSCTLPDGSWSEYQHLAEFKVLPPWHQQTWFVLSCMLSSVLLVVAILAYMGIRKERSLKAELAEERQLMNEEKVDFLVHMSHELRTPLTLVLSALKRVFQQTQPADGRYRLLQTAFRQSERMRDVINMVVDLEKMEQKNMRLHLSPHPFNEWIKENLRDFECEGRERGVKVVLYVDDRIDKVVFDLQKCEIVLRNLLIHALHHSPQGSTVTVKTQWDPMTNLVHVYVSDEGPGLRLEDEEELFSRYYYRGAKDTNGTGLEFAYSKMLIEQHRGMISAFNNKTKGATYYFLLPMQQTDLPAEEERDREQEPEPMLPDVDNEGASLPSLTPADPASRLPYTLLVVDNQKSITRFVQEVLSETFQKVYAANNGVDAWSIVRTEHPDAVICDVRISRMDGYELCRHIKDNQPTSHIPVILFTTQTGAKDVLIGYQAGADAILPKPSDMDTLRQLVINLLHARQHKEASCAK